MPKISVIIPVYGVEQYIERCAESLFNQTLSDIEFLFIDDCSTDRSIELLSNIIKKECHRFTEMNWEVRIERMPTNSGLPAVRRHGIQLAKGDYIIHCDSDDWIEKTMCEELYTSVIINHSDVAVCDFYVCDKDGNKTIKKGCHSSDKDVFLENLLLQKDSWSLVNKLFSKTLYHKDIVYPNKNIGEDMLVCSQLIEGAKKITYVEKPLYNYWYNPSSITKKATKEHVYFKFLHLKENTDLLIQFLSSIDKLPNRNIITSFLQYNALTALFPLIGDSYYYKVWRESYPGAIWNFFFMPGISLKKRLICLFAVLHLYPLKKNRIK